MLSWWGMDAPSKGPSNLGWGRSGHYDRSGMGVEVIPVLAWMLSEIFVIHHGRVGVHAIAVGAWMLWRMGLGPE